MAKMVAWNAEAFEAQCIGVAMDRLEACAELVRDKAKEILESKLKSNWPEHGVYQSGPYKGKYWTEREWHAMIKTIRVVKKHDSSSRNIWIMAGTDKTWWAIQAEYGRGGWRGGSRPFLRPALKTTAGAMLIKSFL